jgi:hypothetical protein
MFTKQFAKQFAKLALTAFVISAAASTQASEITEFPMSSMSTVTRAEVGADARNAAQPRGEVGFSFDAATLARETRSDKTCMEMKSRQLNNKSETVAAGYFIGGM